jgi:hypothetical protein
MNTYPQLVYHPDFDTWSEVNEKELDCIFAETGADRELDFDREKEEEILYNQFI